MHIETLTIEHLRVFDRVVLAPSNGINILTGDNGAGKTSVLEAIHLLSSGRSFRGTIRDALIQRGAPELRVFSALFTEADQRPVRLGLSRGLKQWEARIDGESVDRLSRLFQELAVVCFEPGSHILISGSSEHRRRFVDWALFHVEPAFLVPWRRYQRALKQRNVLLKQGVHTNELLPWEHELAHHGTELTHLRAQWLTRFEPTLKRVTETFIPELGNVRLRFNPGWSGSKDGVESLLEGIVSARSRDMALGHTTVGPHRADWSIGFEQAPVAQMFSRGQEKLVVLACLLAQAESFAESRGEWPVLLLDDVPSELDAAHLHKTLTWLSEVPAQCFITATALNPPDLSYVREMRMFHVEQGQIQALL